MIPFMVDKLSPQDSPATAVENILLQFARESLGLREVAPTDDLFKFEGVSIGVTILIIQIEEHFGIELPLLRIFEFPTLADLAVEVQRLVNSRTR